MDPKDRERAIKNIGPLTALDDATYLVHEVFHAHFGNTSDAARLHDISKEHAELQNAVSYRNRAEEAGDLLCSLLQFMHEQDMDPADAIKATLAKIERRGAIYAANGDKRRVAIYGGAFDPITLGHEAAAKAVLDAPQSDIDEVWFMPPYSYAGSKRPTDAVHRIAMCEIAAKRDPRFRYFDFEMTRQLCGKTIVAARKIKDSELADTYNFSLVIGADVALSVHKWAEADELMRLMPFIVLPRPGVTLETEDQWFTKGSHRYLKDAVLPDISSTKVKELYAQSANGPLSALVEASQLVAPGVHEYIIKHHLYGAA